MVGSPKPPAKTQASGSTEEDEDTLSEEDVKPKKKVPASQGKRTPTATSTRTERESIISRATGKDVLGSHPRHIVPRGEQGSSGSLIDMIQEMSDLAQVDLNAR